jgi:MFS transporter, OFA family, oxalate/formate antiporter
MPSPSAASPRRWVQLVLGLVVMMAISSPQYVWTLFVKPFQTATGAGLATVQITFSVLIVLQTLFSPAQGWLVDRFGPKALVAVGAALTGLGWVLSAHVDNVWMLFLTYGLFCGVGTGIRPRQDRVAVAFIRAPLSLHASPRRRDPSAPRPGPG